MFEWLGERRQMRTAREKSIITKESARCEKASNEIEEFLLRVNSAGIEIPEMIREQIDEDLATYKTLATAFRKDLEKLNNH
ncbi:hypothetical protein H1S01_10770 [Heliobacterium chlorum]|uniref:Uncharacterized protein n=1 Tax=Heliobacterium chlorum TaxID=2698 RepID=A0ABR7T5Q9_HELCL|nr:hypothetical protein [Heliobacterium chlorum]MBC9784991.1 hypothetical protein [Heliobacterium chlorum]